MKKCPPGVFCMGNMTTVLIFFVLAWLVYFHLPFSSSSPVAPSFRSNTVVNVREENLRPSFSSKWLPSWPYSNYGREDVLENPYSAPYRDERYLVPINVSTNIGATGEMTAYRQMGIVTPLNGTSKDNILPLMGRPLFTNRNKWQYYTISNQHNNVKLPISVQGRSGLDEYGVDEISEGATVLVEGYGEPFKVTIYENNTIKYLPFV